MLLRPIEHKIKEPKTIENTGYFGSFSVAAGEGFEPSQTESEPASKNAETPDVSVACGFDIFVLNHFLNHLLF